MTIATGVAKRVAYKVESAWGTAPGTSGAQVLRRVMSDLSLKKQTYESNEVNTHYQRVDFRHGIRSVEGSLNGELSPGTYKDFMAAAVRRAFTTVTAMPTLSITIAGSGPTYTVARGSGSFLTDGVKAGHVVRLTAGSFNAANLNKNLLVVSLVAATLTVMPLNGVALVAEGPIASATVSVPGKVTYAPTTGHTDLSYAIEHWHSDVALSELFLGCKVDQMDIGLPATGMSTLGMRFIGKDVTVAGSAYYLTPTVETSTGILAAVNGLLLAQGGAVAVLTGLDISIRNNMNAVPVVGSNTYADIAEGRFVVDGRVTALFENATIRDYFLNETEVSLVAALSASGSAAADFVAFTLPRVKFGAADKDDGDKSIIQTLPFTGLYNAAGGAGISSEQTTLNIQDSQA
jgi:hypothetical protein